MGMLFLSAQTYFYGMMNDVDKSIDAFDLALRRRFQWIRMDCDYDVIKNVFKFKERDGSPMLINTRCCRSLNEYISGTEGQGLGLGKSYRFGPVFSENSCHCEKDQ